MEDGETDAPPLWYRDIYPAGETDGFYERLGAHSLVHVDRGPARIVVAFDNLSSVNNRRLDREPWAYKFCRDHGYSYLGIMARRMSWFRDPQLIGRLEALASAGFFARFGEVVMAGSSMGAFGALAFAPLAPGCRVLAFNPQSTLDARLVPWEDRYARGQAQDWELPYSDAASGIASAERSLVFFDPYCREDQGHRDRLSAPGVEHFETWYSGHKSAVYLNKIGILKDVMRAGIEGSLTRQDFHALLRGRRNTYWYRNALIGAAEERGHARLAELALARWRKINADEIKRVKRARRQARMETESEEAA